jgi:hypothetical protein
MPGDEDRRAENEGTPDHDHPADADPLVLRGWIKMADEDAVTIVDTRGREQTALFVRGSRVLDDQGRPVRRTALRACQTVTIDPTTIDVVVAGQEPDDTGETNGYTASIAGVDIVGSSLEMERGRRTERIQLEPRTTRLTRGGEPIDMEELEEGQRVRIEPGVVRVESAATAVGTDGTDADPADGLYRGRIVERYPRYRRREPRPAGTMIAVALDGEDWTRPTFHVTEDTKILEGETPAAESALFECRRVAVRARMLEVLTGHEASSAPDEDTYVAEVVDIDIYDGAVSLRVGDRPHVLDLGSAVVTRDGTALGFGDDRFRKMELLNVGDRVRVTPLVVRILQ